MLPVEFLPDVDELPVSWMNRLALANGFIDVNDMLRSYRIIDGKKVVRHLDYFPKVLGLISDNTWSKSILSIYKQDVKDQYDIIPYHNDEHLCVCPECMKEDMTRFGHIVYHFQHQYPGSFTCWKHKCILEYVLMLAYKQDQSKRENLHQWYNRKRMIQRQRKAKENGK